MHKIILLFFVLMSGNVFSMAPKMSVEKAINHAVIRYGLPEEPELIRYFEQAKVTYPPYQIALLAFKREKTLQLWARNENQPWRKIHTYPLTAFSGKLGPKLKENDRQIPEGIYKLTSFNPFSAHHLSMMINYPNDYDQLQASKENRKKLGGNIFIHGKATSVGCLAVGNKAIDQLFLLVRRVGLKNTKVIIAPYDLRTSKPATASVTQPKWLPDLYARISYALKEFPDRN